MSATLYVPTPLRRLTNGQSKLPLAATDIADIIERAETQYPGFRERVLDADGEIKRFINIFRQRCGRAHAARQSDAAERRRRSFGHPRDGRWKMSKYPNPAILVEVDGLKQHLGDPHIRILDVRASDPRLPIGYRMGHLPGALALEPTRDFFIFPNGAPDLAPPEQIARALAQRGIANDTPVVIYDEWTGLLAAMTYWVLRYVGHREIKILHGGWAMWEHDGGATTHAVPVVAPAVYHAQVNADARATAEWIQANTSRPDVLLLDTRTPDEYAMGHIAGAMNLSYDASLELETHTFKDAATLRAQLEAVGATPDKEIVAYCSHGARSSHTFVALQLLGYPRVRNYDGSMADWHHRRGLPVK